MSRAFLVRSGVLAIAALACGGCSLAQKKIPPKATYRADYVASSDGVSFQPLLSFMDRAEKLRGSCGKIDRAQIVKAQYTISRNDDGIKIAVKNCESTPENCSKLEECLAGRPVPWLTRASGRSGERAGTIYSDWLGRCGGEVAVNFYFGPLEEFPVERVGCSEPQHDPVDTAYEMFMVARPETEKAPAAGPYIEQLLKRWNTIVFRRPGAH